MSKKNDYVPNAHNLFYLFALTMVNMVVANAVAWGIVASDASAFQTAFDAYKALYNAQTNKRTRTLEQVDAHNEGRTVFEKLLRDFVRQWLIGNPAIPFATKKAMGLNPPTGKQHERPKIETAPDVILQAKPGTKVLVQCRVDKDSSRPSMHPYADVAEVRYAIGTAPANWKGATNIITSKSARFFIELEPEDAGKPIFIFIRWANQSEPKKSSNYCSMLFVTLIG